MLQTIIHPSVNSEMSYKQEGQNFAYISIWSTEAQEVILPNPNGFLAYQVMVKQCI